MAKKTKSTSVWVRRIVMAGILSVLWMLVPNHWPIKKIATWQRLANPGELSQAHSFLGNRCEACHTANTGADPVNCIVCHGNNERLMARQSTAFHAFVGTCTPCHREHLGRSYGTASMDHRALSDIGQTQLARSDASLEGQNILLAHQAWMSKTRDKSLPHARVSRDELILQCLTCHREVDPHAGYLGDECATCHATDTWQVPGYVHPPDTSTDCAQCHKTPPSHNMPMFLAKCAKSLGKTVTSPRTCYVCHEIYSWNTMRDNPAHRYQKSHRAVRED